MMERGGRVRSSRLDPPRATRGATALGAMPGQWRRGPGGTHARPGERRIAAPAMLEDVPFTQRPVSRGTGCWSR
jgi:hypothetical protein